MKKSISISTILLGAFSTGCVPPPSHVPTVIPSLEYTKQFSQDSTQAAPARAAAAAAGTMNQLNTTPVVSNSFQSTTPQVRLVEGEAAALNPQGAGGDQIVSNHDLSENLEDVHVERSSRAMVRDYQGPLALGDPGVGASLWKESRSSNDIFRDERAWLPGDLVTITVEEKDQGSRQAKTDTKSESTLEVALSKLFGVETSVTDRNANVDPTSLLNAGTSSEFKGEGKTDRKNSLTAKISAMVAEVLPNGILRIEGKKIVAVNDEEQIMVISGLVRPRDISSVNEVSSSKIANMRIDYYGKGTVDEAQRPGWGLRLVKVIWPF